MENKYTYIDESGDTGYKKKSSRYFILTSVIVDDIFLLRRIAKDIHKFKIDRSVNFHAHKEGKIVKNKLVQKIIESSIQCVAYVFDKDKQLTKDVYMYTLEELAKYFKENNIKNVIIARKDVRKHYNKKILEMYLQYGLNASFSEPNKEKSLQIADFYSWCIFSNFEHDLPEYFIELQNLIIIIKKQSLP
jgi:Protein of unknown function (DUF3800)